MKKTIAALVLACAAAIAVMAPVEAQAEGKTPAAQPKLPGTEEAPGFEDFEKGDLSPQDVEEQEERRDDRNVLSPSMEDGEPLPGMDPDSDQ
jgi:hypothetical protein